MSASAPFRVTFLGTGTSTGVPVIGCGCVVCTSTDPRNARMRCSLLLETPTAHLLVDCGPDFRRQAARFRIARIDHVLLTHEHADHVNGLDELRIYNFMTRRKLPMSGLPRVLDSIRVRFDYCFAPPQAGGGVPQFDLVPRAPGDAFDLGGVEVVPILYKHGILDVLGYRFGGQLAYMTDCSAIPDATFDAVRGIDTLVLGALRPKEHPTHFNLAQAQEAAARIGARRTLFVHMTHDIEHTRDGAALAPGCAFAYDGQVLEFGETRT